MNGETVISYGKAAVPVYRAFGTPLTGLRPVPESTFTGRENTLMAAEIDVEVYGENFLPAYTEGDNSAVVATDSMKNFILRHALSYDGATLEGFLAELGRGFLETYDDMESLHLSGRELRFDPVQGVLYRRSHDDHGVAEVRVDRGSKGGPRSPTCERDASDLELLKVTGSSFTRFVRDEYTTLPERVDRPLFIHLDVHWRYAQISDATGLDTSRYVASEQVRDVVAAVFSEVVSESIQQLVWEMAERLLLRFPQLVEVSFSAKNLHARAGRASVPTTSASRSRATRSPPSARSR